MRKCISSGSLCSLYSTRGKSREHTDSGIANGEADGRSSPCNTAKGAPDQPSCRQHGKQGPLGPWVVKCSPGPRARPGPAPEIDAELWKLHNLWRERKQQQGEGSQYAQESCRNSVSSFERRSAADSRSSLLYREGPSSLTDSTDLTKQQSNSSSWSDGSNCSLSSLTGARQVAFIRRSEPVPLRAVSLPKALAFSDDRYASSRSSDSSQVAEVTETLQRQRASLDSDEGSEMDADCCGDSGVISLRGRRAGSSGQLSHSTTKRASSISALSLARSQISSDEESDMALPGTPRVLNRWHSSLYVSGGQAAVELFYRLNHARQTMDYVRRQAATYAKLERKVMSVWEALGMLGTLREYETALLQEEGTDADMPLVAHAMQTAENCRAAFPDLDWLHLVGLIHSLGKVLAHKQMGAEPQWAVCGESFPVGCRFHPAIACSQFFSINPDRRRRIYTSPTGIYKEGCGLASVHMSWSASEYLYMVLVLNRTRLPPEALFLIRHQRFFALNRPGQPYAELLSESDSLMVPWLARFRQLSAYCCADPAIPPQQARLTGQAFREYYCGLIRKYIPSGTLRW